MGDEQDQTETGAVVKRGPAFPFIGLTKAVERTQELYAKAKRFEVRLSDAAADWGYGAKSSGAFQTAAALLAYGLIDDSGSGDARKVKVSDAGWRILEDQRPGVREKLLAEAALKPKLFAEFAERWRDGRPDDTHAISDLKFDHGFTDESAPRFLRVFDDVVGFTKPAQADKKQELERVDDKPNLGSLTDTIRDFSEGGRYRAPSSGGKPEMQKGVLMEGERELTTGLLSKAASFRLIVNGRIGKKELERLIQKLELDKEILADDDEETDAVKQGDDLES